MRTKEEFEKEFFSEKCFYWTADVEKTNRVLEVAKFLGIQMHTGRDCEPRTEPMALLTVLQREDGAKYMQKSNWWHPNYELNVRSENCMYAEYEEFLK